MKEIVLIDRKGREAFRCPLPELIPPSICHNGKVFSFGAAKLSGEQYFYEISPEIPSARLLTPNKQ